MGKQFFRVAHGVELVFDAGDILIGTADENFRDFHFPSHVRFLPAGNPAPVTVKIFLPFGATALNISESGRKSNNIFQTIFLFAHPKLHNTLGIMSLRLYKIIFTITHKYLKYFHDLI
jgi:hypothetical protein